MLYTSEYAGLNEMVLVNKDTTKKNKPMLWHTHEFIEIEYISSGEGVQYFNGVEHKVKRGDLLIFDIGEGHSYYTDTKFEVFNCIFIPTLFSNSGDIYGDWKRIIESDGIVKTPCLLHFSGEHSVQIERLFWTMEEQCNRKLVNHQEILKTSIHLLLSIISQHSYSEFSPTSTYYLILNYLEHLINDNLDYSLRSVANHFNYKPNYFSKYFKKNTGMSYTDYIAHKRIDKAMYLIMHTSETMENICYKSGFKDKKQFYISFKQYIGTTPKQLRRIPVQPKGNEETDNNYKKV